jgi:transposase
MEARGLDDEALGAFLRREGIHKAHLDQWQRDVLNALGAKPSKTKANVADMTAHKRVKELEVELNRKDKALAETAALLVLQKKVQDLWGDKG